MNLILVAVIGIAVLYVDVAYSATGCRSGDVLASHQECPLYEMGITLKVNQNGEFCLEPSFLGGGCSASFGTRRGFGILSGQRFEYEARPLAPNSWKLLSVTPEPPNPNRSVFARGEISPSTTRDTVTIVAAQFFEDPDGDDLAYSVEAAEFPEYSAEVGNDWVSITPGSPGVGTFTIRATDPGGLFETQDVLLEVIGQQETRPPVVPLFVSSWNSANGQQGFLRVINRSMVDGEFVIKATDDAGLRATEVIALPISAGASVHVNADDLEMGNEDRGIARGFGRGQGDWWLEIESDLDIDVLSYVRTQDGFVSSLHDVVSAAMGAHRVVYLNPGSNTDQVSKLRIVNLDESEQVVKIIGIDDKARETGPVSIAIPALGARVVTAAELEAGGGFEGRLGDGFGKWRLRIHASGDVLIMSLLESPTGHLTNLSSALQTGRRVAE